jgi:hypothetical protein
MSCNHQVIYSLTESCRLTNVRVILPGLLGANEMCDSIIQVLGKGSAIIDGPCTDLVILVAKIHSSCEVDFPERLPNRLLAHFGQSGKFGF